MMLKDPKHPGTSLMMHPSSCLGCIFHLGIFYLWCLSHLVDFCLVRGPLDFNGPMTGLIILKSSQVTFIYISLFTIQIVSGSFTVTTWK